MQSFKTLISYLLFFKFPAEKNLNQPKMVFWSSWSQPAQASLFAGFKMLFNRSDLENQLSNELTASTSFYSDWEII